MSIPRTIHYCWFGGNPLPEKVKACIESWKRCCPDYKIVEWNEDNYDVVKIPYVRQAYEADKWAFVSDYARLDIVYQHGGIYLDTDVELLKSLDVLLEEKLVLAMEKYDQKINTGLGFAAEKGNMTLRRLMETYHGISFRMADGTLNLKGCPQYTTEYFLPRGYVLEDKTQRVEDALILASEYFCPMNYHTGMIEVTSKTMGIHWYEASWFEKGDKAIHNVERKIRRHFPGWLAKMLCFIYRKSYRLVEYTRKGILMEKLRSSMRKRL